MSKNTLQGLLHKKTFNKVLRHLSKTHVQRDFRK